MLNLDLFPIRLSALARWFRKGVPLVILLVGGAVAYLLGRSFVLPTPVERGQILSASPAALDFGEVLEPQAFPWIVPITNCSPSQVEVVKFQSSCNCVRVEPNQLVMEPGETVDVCLTLDLMKSVSKESPAHIRECEIRLVPIMCDQAEKQDGWIVHGRIKSAFTLTPESLEFWYGINLGEPYPAKNVTVQGHDCLKDIRVKYDISKLRVAVVHENRDPETWQLQVAPSDGLPPDRFSALITVEGVTTEKSACPVKNILVVGRVSTDVQVFPSAISFGSQSVGESHSETLTICSKADRGFALEDIESPSSDILATRVPDSASNCTIVRVTERFIDSGYHSSFVRLTIRDHRGSLLVIPVEVSYSGVSNLRAARPSGGQE